MSQQIKDHLPKTALSDDTPNDTMKPIPYVGAVPLKYKRYIRNKAIERARTRIIVAGNDPQKLSQQDLEVVVREEEDKIKGSIKEKGLMAVLALLGLNLFV
jgi:hypothetical protein